MVQKYEKDLPLKGILTITSDNVICIDKRQFYFEGNKFYSYESENTEYNKQFPVKKPRLRKDDEYSVREIA